MAWCLTVKAANELLRRFKSGEITPDNLIDMGSAKRNVYFTKFMGKENAAKSNALFESKLLLKNQKVGLTDWLKRTTGLKLEVRRDMLATVRRLEKVLDVTEESAFLNDLVNQRLGVGVTLKEANTISSLAKTVMEKKAKVRDDFTFATEAEFWDYGNAHVGFRNYVIELKAAADKPTVKEYLKHPHWFISDVAGTAKAVKASMDNSGLLNQGWKMIFNHPGIWKRNGLKTFSDAVKTVGGKKMMDVVDAGIVARPNSLNGRYKRSKAQLGVIEEEFPTSIAERVPLAGRLYKASEVAFTGFARRNRADLVDFYYRVAEKTGQDVNNILLERDIGTLANSLTSRGSLGRLEPIGDVVNKMFFSGRKFRSDWDLLTGHTGGLGLKTAFARKQAAMNTLRLISGSAAVLVAARALRPESVEWNFLSADFGKIRIGDKRYDVTGKIAPIATLVGRLILNEYKSSTTGKVYDMSEKDFGMPTRLDMIYRFGENKFSPAASVVKDLLRQETFEREKPTVGYEMTNLFEPFTSDLARELVREKISAGKKISADDAITLLLDGLGVVVNIYPGYAQLAEIEKRSGRNAEWKRVYMKLIKGGRTFDTAAYNQVLREME